MEKNDKEISVLFQESYKTFINNWKFFLISTILCFTASYFYLKLKVNIYNISATILVKEDQKNSLDNQMGEFQNLGFNFSKIGSSLEDEIEILKSRKLISNVVKKLNLTTSYFLNENTINKELYNNTYITLKSINNVELLNNTEIYIKPLNNYNFSLETNTKKYLSKYSYGEKIKINNSEIIILPKGNIKKVIGKKLLIKFNSKDITVNNILNKLKIEKINKESSTIRISLTHENIEKAKAIINCLVNEHDLDAKNDKNKINNNTLKFINERLSFITDELSLVENNVRNFKSDNKIFDLEKNAGIYFEKESENEKLLLSLNNQLNIAEYVEDYLIKSKESDLIPANLGIENEGIENLIGSLNSLILERNKLLITSKEINPIVSNLREQIIGLKLSLKESLKNQKTSIKIQLKSIERKNREIERKISSAPKQEKDFKDIARQQQIKESLYLFLLQKREETTLSLAITESNTKLIDEAFSDGKIISPKKIIVYILSIIIGFLIPIIILFIKKILDTKIQTRDDLSHLNIPIIGNLPLSKNKNIFINQGDRDSIAEAFRLLRTNINFQIINNSKKCKTIFVTSTFSSEGKSFVSINLASTIAMSEKKVLLIGLDLRLPKLLEYLGEKENLGVTNFIINNDLTIQDIIIKSNKINNVDIISSGTIPPNPSELLMSERLNKLIEDAEKIYDYIIVDTAPVGLVTDTLLVKDFADLTLYITRANVLEKKSLTILKDIYDNNKLRNISVIINGIDFDSNYGYGYGYGNYIEKNKLKKLKSLIGFGK